MPGPEHRPDDFDEPSEEQHSTLPDAAGSPTADGGKQVPSEVPDETAEFPGAIPEPEGVDELIAEAAPSEQSVPADPAQQPDESAQAGDAADAASAEDPAQPEAAFGHEGYGDSDARQDPDAEPAHLVPTPQGAVVNEGEPFAAAPTGADAASGTGRRAGRRAAPKRRLTTAQLVAILTGVVAAVIVSILVLVMALRNAHHEPAASDAPSSQSTIQDGTPAATVRDLGTALAKGDASAALKLMDVSTLNYDGDTHPLLSDAVYRGAKNRPSSIEVAPESMAAPSEDAVSAGVTATVTQNGKKSTLSLRLTRASAQDPWLVALPSLPVVQVTDAGGATVKVNGASAKIPGSANDYSTARLFVLPGTYSIQRENDKYVQYPKARSFSASAAALAVSPDPQTRQLGTVSLQGKYNDAFRKAARKSADAWLDKCLASSSTSPKNCPMQVHATYKGATVTNVKWQAQTRPKISFSDSGLGEQQLYGEGGHATMTGKAKVKGDTIELEAKNVGLDFTGVVQVKGNKVTFAPVD